MLNQVRALTGILIVAVLVYAGLWYTAAFEAEKDVAKLLSSWRDKGVKVEHGRIAHGGFPYRITVSVTDIEVTTRNKGLSVKADDLLLITHLWTPEHWLVEAQNPAISAANKALEMQAETLMASYKVHESGETIVALSSETTTGTRFQKLLNFEPASLSDWSLYLNLNPRTSPAESGLYAATLIDFKMGGRWGTGTTKPSLVLSGSITEPAIRDWTKKDLQNWAFEGGLLELENITYSMGNSQLSGNASLTLDDRFRLLGSASLHATDAQALYKTLHRVGLKNTSTLPTNGPISLMAQNGEVTSGSNKLIQLKPLMK